MTTFELVQTPRQIQENNINSKYIDSLKEFYAKPLKSTWASKHYKKILALYYKRIIPKYSSILEVGCGDGELLSHFDNQDITGVDLSDFQVAKAKQKLPNAKFYVQEGESLKLERRFDYIILSETVNQSVDVQSLLQNLLNVSHDKTRLILNFYNTAWRPLLTLATWLKLKSKQPDTNWLNAEDLKNLLTLSNWELIKQQRRILCPVRLFGVEKLINRFIAPILSWFCLTTFQIARPVQNEKKNYSVSVVIPARNEAGNIKTALSRIPQLGKHTEIIFVEGHSKDDTWAEIKKLPDNLGSKKSVIKFQQSGKGKGNAVREAFEKASGEILVILDADLTVPPEELPKFYEVLASGKADFCNGVRLVYPMEKEAMRFLNLCANKFFGLAFTWALNQPIKDTLCGTKVLFKTDYQSIAANRDYFGDFDPFGDFDLLFGADHLLLKIVDLPIRYRDRTYGSTNINRWRHGVLLLRMLTIAIRKLKLG